MDKTIAHTHTRGKNLHCISYTCTHFLIFSCEIKIHVMNVQKCYLTFCTPCMALSVFEENAHQHKFPR